MSLFRMWPVKITDSWFLCWKHVKRNHFSFGVKDELWDNWNHKPWLRKRSTGNASCAVMGNSLRKTVYEDFRKETIRLYNKGTKHITAFFTESLMWILDKVLSKLMSLEEELQSIRINNFKMVCTARIPYEQFLQQYGLILRGDGQANHLTFSCNVDPDGENKENELLFEPLDMLYKKQLQLTPKRKSTTPKRRLRRRAGEIYLYICFLLLFLFLFVYVSFFF